MPVLANEIERIREVFYFGSVSVGEILPTKLTLMKACVSHSLVRRKFFLLFLTVVTVFYVSAQKNKTADPNLPAFGQVEKADLQMKECDFDDKAEAMVILDDGELAYIPNIGMELNRRLRIKILNTKGLDWANVHLPYRIETGGSQYISDIEAQTYNLDEAGNIVTTKVDKKLVYDKKLSKRNAEKVFTFPQAKVGSIIEYKYKYNGAGLIDWYFQRSIPVRYSRFRLDFPDQIDVAVIPYCAHEYQKTHETPGTRVVDTYIMSKVPALHDEPFVINEDVYRDRLETKVVAFNIDGRRINRVVNWIDVIKFLMEDEDFGTQVKKNIPRTADLDEKLKSITTPYERMKTIYKYVQDNMQWNEYTGIWALDGVKSAWKDKKGTAGEMNLILVNLLKDAGLNAHPLLVSSHDHGVVNTIDAGTKDYPGFNQFNKVVAYLELDGAPYILDATQKGTPAHLIPTDILMTQGLAIEKIETQEWGWKTLWKESATAKNVIRINGTIDEGGKMAGEAVINSFDYARLARMATVKAGKEKFIERYATDPNARLAVDGVEFDNLQSDSLPLLQTVKFKQTLNTTGDYKYFSANLLTGLEKNPFVAENRSADVFFGYNQNTLIYGSFSAPEGYEFDELPKNIRMIMPDTSIAISRQSQVNGNMLQTKIQIDFKKPIYGVTEYGDLQAFYQRLFEILNEQFVVRKKTSKP